MNIQNIMNSFSQNSEQTNLKSGNSPQNNTNEASPLESIASMIPGGLAGGAAAGGVMALLLGSKSTGKMVQKVATVGGTAVLGGLAYKAYGNWQQNKALGQTQPITDDEIYDIQQDSNTALAVNNTDESQQLPMTLIKAMIAATKADGSIDQIEHKRLSESIEKLNIHPNVKGSIFDLMGREITVEEISSSVNSEEHKAEVYLSAYMAIDVDNHAERTFLNNLAIALNMPQGFPAYLEQQADQDLAV